MTTSGTIDIRDVQGRTRRVRVGRLLASGGAGSIHEVSGDPSSVLKLYHPNVLLSDGGGYSERIEAMLHLKPELPDISFDGRRYIQLAWPTHIAHEGKNFLGFVMPALELGHTKSLELAINEKQASKAGLRTDLGARVTLARQLAGLVEALHKRGHYVVDLKPINIKFYPDALFMAVLDCDGFNIHDHHSRKRFPAPQYTLDYLAPEFQNHAGDPNLHPEQQDRFALAVIVFQLLNHGIHPYTGRLTKGIEPSSIVERIAQNLYPFGLKSNPLILPPLYSGHESIPRELRMLFDRAFNRQAEQRPSSREWREMLSEYAQADSGKLIRCSKQHIHFADTHCSSCLRKDSMAMPPKVPPPMEPTTNGTYPKQQTQKSRPQRVKSSWREKLLGLLAALWIPVCLLFLLISITSPAFYWLAFLFSIQLAACLGYIIALTTGNPTRKEKTLIYIAKWALPIFIAVAGLKYVVTKEQPRLNPAISEKHQGQAPPKPSIYRAPIE